ncbi:hypothetical protein GR211_33420 [Rhizobium leguminosarum]|uniref:hypothetical protein n=1 Tax=Rhizobium TaxID=379 RepID=UPI0013BB43F6|nr:hypothetical protein [Rhizobium ruizarguesonis]NEJ17749.1 hypothetical protein [Rhizobium ruizarguesonis]NEK31727.1 hypothetical protein [Rhizobium ruizarguesonis]
MLSMVCSFNSLLRGVKVRIRAASALFFLTSLMLASKSLAACPETAGEGALTSWFPTTPLPSYTQKPPAHPEPDCPFYIEAWHNFMFDAMPDTDGRANFLSFPSMGSLFDAQIATSNLLSLAPRSIQMPNDASTFQMTAALTKIAGAAATSVDAGIEQAGNAAILFDQRGYPVYYGIHVNDQFAKFVKDNGLTTKSAIENASDTLAFPEGIVELKSAWRVLTHENEGDTYITTWADVPSLHVVNNRIEVDRAADPRRVRLGLFAIHVVFTLKGHPEFIWSTFEHSDLNGATDLAPSAPVNPDSNGSGPATAISPFDYLLYHGGTLGTVANIAPTFSEQAAAFNEKTQRLDKGGVLPTSVYRAYPEAKPTTIEQDDDLRDLNAFMLGQFQDGKLPATDKRQFYRLVGATWLDKPEESFLLNKPFSNQPGESSDDGIVAGEDALSSLAMESFTQIEQPNCFSCHDTKRVKSVSGTVILKPLLLNVSHIFSKYVSEH